MEALFHGRDPSLNGRIEIGPGKDSARDHLRIEIAHPSKKQAAHLEKLGLNLSGGDLRVLKTVFQDREDVVPWLLARDEWSSGRFLRSSLSYRRQRLIDQNKPPPEIECVALGPGFLRNEEVAAFWDNVVLAGDEVHAVAALQLVLGDAVESVAMVGDTLPRARRTGRRAVVKLRNHDRRVPLKSLGDGATRAFWRCPSPRQ